MIRFFLIFLISFIESSMGLSQTGYWKNALADPDLSNEEKAYFADSLLLHYRRSNPDSAIYFARIVLQFALDARDTASADYAFVNLGSLKRIKGEYDSAVYFYQIALASYTQRNYEEGIASVYNNLATVYKTQSRYDLAIKNYYEALSVFQNSENFNARANLYSSFAELYFKLENYQKAYDYWALAETDYLRGDRPSEVTYCYRGHVRLFLKWNKTREAENELQKALETDQKNGISVLILEDLLLYLELFNLTGNYIQFKSYADSVAFYLKSIDNPASKATYYEQTGDYYFATENNRLAKEQYDSCLIFATKDELPETRLRVLKKLIKTELTLERSERSLLLFSEIEILERLVSSIRRDRITQEMDAEFQLADKEEKIILLDEKNKTTEQLVKKERELKEKSEQQVLYLWLGILAFLLFLIYIILTNRKLNLTKKDLQKSVEQKEFLFRELNHRVKNNLHIVNSFLGIEMHGKSEEVQEILQICEGRIHSLGLMHEMLYQGDITGMVELKSYLNKLSSFLSTSLINANATISVQVNNDILVSGQKIVLIGLITNELITNAIKYAKDDSRNLSIQIVAMAEKNNVSISVTDNGVGLKEDFNPQKSSSLGMKMAYGLTRQLGGTFSYQNANPGSSFIFSFQV